MSKICYRRFQVGDYFVRLSNQLAYPFKGMIITFRIKQVLTTLSCNSILVIFPEIDIAKKRHAKGLWRQVTINFLLGTISINFT